MVNPQDLVLNSESEAELQGPDAKHNNQNMDVLRDYAGRTPSKPRRFVSHFLKGPAALEGEGRGEGGKGNSCFCKLDSRLMHAGMT